MAITDAEAIKFTNDYIRPMCENLRYMTARGADWSKKWAELSSKFPDSNSEAVEDGREAEGISRLTGADINAVATVFASLLTIMDANAQAAVTKPCVRPLLYNSPE
jgi:hypothetical protein